MIKNRLGAILLAIVSLVLTQGRLPAQATPAPRVVRKNPYDLLGHVLAPIAAVFCPASPKAAVNQPRALTATLVLDSMTGAPDLLAGTRLEIVVQPPNRILLRVPLAGQSVTVCRDDQEVWIEPRIAAVALPGQPLNPAIPGADPVSANPKKGKRRSGAIAPMVLPFPPQQLAFLPVLFSVKEAPEVEGMRLLDTRLMSELARHLRVEEWSARLFVRPAADGQSRPQLAAIELARPGWHLTVRVESLEYSGELPETTWKPATPDALRLSGSQAKQWIEGIVRQINPS